MKPKEIEDLSFKIIEDEASGHGFDDRHWPIVRRMIHTSADFEYIQTVRFHTGAIENGVAAIKRGCTIFTDTHMARVGIRKTETRSFNIDVKCLIADPGIADQAVSKGITRAQAAVDMAAPDMENGIYVVGNAPTALLRLIELIKAGKARPALVIGFPVGFVNAAESKEELIRMNHPHISNTGRKGGSNIAASIVNALLIMADTD
ncbi:MAG: precorrin-8X methylmutase [Desulfobacteraceae bacterium]|nr:MAG: precorrin-8X methylmutase [Desulfobacteraceae bacterium]